MQRYFHSLKFEVGQVFPIANPFERQAEGSLLMAKDDGVNFVVYSDEADADEYIFRTQPITLGLTTWRNLPFMGMQVGDGLRFLFTFNLYAIVGDERRRWLRDALGPMSAMLVDNETGKLRLVRTMDVPVWLTKLREVAALQLNDHEGFDSVNEEFMRLGRKFTAMDVLQKAKERELMRVGDPGSWFVQILPPVK